MGRLGILICMIIGCFQMIDAMSQPWEKELIELLEIARGHHNHQHSSQASSEEDLEFSESGFPYIRGPECFDDKIAIVGAGPAGVHMAMKLKKAGFQNVVVFEKEDEVGGKSKTVDYRDVVHELGTCYTQPDYTELYRLLQEYDAGELLPLPSPAVWFGENILSSLEYTLFPTIQSLAGSTNPAEIVPAFFATVYRYVAVHQQLFGNYTGELMPRPSDEILKNELNMTFFQFFQKHNVEDLSQMILQIHTAQGYGHIDEIPALYGLTWVTPNSIVNLLTPPPEEVSNAKLLSEGYQTVWKKIVEEENINVRLSSPVTKIIRKKKKQKGKKRGRRSAFTVKYECPNSSERSEEFDFLILTPEMKLLSNLDIIEFNEEEKELFDKMNHQFYTTSLVTTTYGQTRAFSPQSYYADNIQSKQDMKIWVQRDSYNSLEYNVGVNYTNGLYPGAPDGNFTQTSVYYQFSKEEPNLADLERELRAHIEDRENATVLEIRDVNVWDYFPQFSVADTASGITWDIFDIQGKYKIWYAGSSVYFESAKSVMEYNNLIFRQFRLPEDSEEK